MSAEADLGAQSAGRPPSRKGVQRQQTIIEATLRLIAREGMQGVSMRAVAAEARVPLGTVTYYFSEKDDLVEVAFLHHAQRETERVVRALPSLGNASTPRDVARSLADFVILGLGQHRDQLLVEYQFLVESARRENLRRASTAWLQSLTVHLEALVSGMASTTPKTDAHLILAVLAGLEVDNLGVAPEASNRRVITAVLERLLTSLDLAWEAERDPRPRPTSTRPTSTRPTSRRRS